MNYDKVHRFNGLSTIHHNGYPPPILSTLPILEKIAQNEFSQTLIMEDTVCISNASDTFFVNSAPEIIAYDWTLPNGAVISNTIGDTMIVVDWTNAMLGLSEVCVSSVNNCGSSAPFCMPIRIINCNLSPNAVDDRDTILANTTAIVQVQTNDSDPENQPLTTNLDPSNSPSNGTVSIYP